MKKPKKEVPQKPLPEQEKQIPEAVKKYLQHVEDENKELKEEIERLKGLLRMTSENSSKPPSSDGLRKSPVKNTIPGSQRRKNRKKTGGQIGHAGTTLTQVVKPDFTIIHAHSECGCGMDLNKTKALRVQKIQVFDLPKTSLQVTEHQLEVKICPCCHVKSQPALPPGITDAQVQYGPILKAQATYLMNQHLVPSRRVGEILADFYGANLSSGSIVRWSDEAYRILAPFEFEVKEAIINSPVVHFDETGMRCAGALHWLHSASTAELTFFGLHKERGMGAMKEFGVLPRFKGIAVHDHWKTYFKFESCLHALCNAHIVRELLFLHEEFKERWAGKMKKLILRMHRLVDQAKERGQEQLARATRRKLEHKFKKILASGYRYHEDDVAFARGARGRIKQTKGKNLLDRLRDYKTEALRFMNDFEVPFSNNQGEQDLRMNKVKQKISGCFRSLPGGKVFCRIRSYLSTRRKQGHNLFTAIHQVFLKQPISICLPIPA